MPRSAKIQSTSAFGQFRKRAHELLVACNSDIGIRFMYHEACLKESFA
jgi:hypothetical protein